MGPEASNQTDVTVFYRMEFDDHSASVANAAIRKFSEGFAPLEKALNDVGIQSGAFINSFKNIGGSVSAISKLTEELEHTADVTKRNNLQLQINKQAWSVVGEVAGRVGAIFKANLKIMNQANDNWEQFRRANVMTASELNKTVGSFEKAGASALMNTKEVGEAAFVFRKAGLVLDETNKDLITTTGKLATVFNVDTAQAATFVAKQYQYLGLTTKDLEYATGRLIPTQKALGLTGEESLGIFEKLGPTISLVYAQGKNEGFRFQESLLRLSGVMKSFGLSSDGIAKQIDSVMNAEQEGIRSNILIASQLGMSYDELMRKMIDSPAEYSVAQAQAFENTIRNFNEYSIGGMIAIKKFADMYGIQKDQMMEILRLRKQGLSFAVEERKKLEEAMKKEDEYKRSGRKGLDDAFKDQISSLSLGWSKLKGGLDSLWASSLRPVLGTVLGALGHLMGALGSLFGMLASNKVIGTLGVIAATVTTLVGSIGFLVKPIASLGGHFGFISKALSFGPLGKLLSTFGIGGGTRAALATGERAEMGIMGWLKSGATSPIAKLTGKGFSKILGKFFLVLEPIMMLIDAFTTQGDWSTKLGTALAGSKKGGLGGAASGALRWGAIGAGIGALFFGGGAIPGAIIGTIVGALLGGIGGENIGGFIKKRSGALIGASIFGLLLPGVGAPLGYLLGSLFDGKGGEAGVNFSEFGKGFFGSLIKPFKELGATVSVLVDTFKLIYEPVKEAIKPAIEQLDKTFGGKGETFKKVGTLFGTLVVTLNPLIVGLRILAGVVMELARYRLQFEIAKEKLKENPWQKLHGGSDRRKELEAQLGNINAQEMTMGAGGGGNVTQPTTPMGRISNIAAKPFAAVASFFGGENASQKIGGGGGAGAVGTGNFGTLKEGIAKTESGSSGGYLAANRSTSATGKYQFIRGTAKQLNDQYNLGVAPEVFSNTESYRQYMFSNPQFQEKLMDSYLAQNISYAKRVKGTGKVTDVDLAMMHFMGAGGWKSWVDSGANPNFRPSAINMTVGGYQKSSGLTGAIMAAEGALITKPTFTLMGEAGTELVTPMNKIDHIMTSVIQKALSVAGKTALPSTEPMTSAMNNLLAVQKEQLNVLNSILRETSRNSKETIKSNKTSDDLTIMKWSLPPMQ